MNKKDNEERVGDALLDSFFNFENPSSTVRRVSNLTYEKALSKELSFDMSSHNSN